MNVDHERDVTARGFRIVKFADRYGAPCSLQKSSLATEDAVWLGIDDAAPQVLASEAADHGIATDQTTGWVSYPLPPGVNLTTRMHLTQEQAAWLIRELTHFVETGELMP